LFVPFWHMASTLMNYQFNTFHLTPIYQGYQDEAPGTVLCHWNIQCQKRPCGQPLFPFWSNQDEAPGTVLCRWNIQCQKRPWGQCLFHFGQIRMKRPGPSFVMGTPIARRGPADNAFFHFGQIRMKHPGPSFVIGTSNARSKRPCGQCFFPFWSNQDEAPGTVLCRWNIQHQKRPCRQRFFLLVKSG
jgi:uncharacterized protein YodC (DUF2158 family)